MGTFKSFHVAKTSEALRIPRLPSDYILIGALPLPVLYLVPDVPSVWCICLHPQNDVPKVMVEWVCPQKDVL
jgi:hypothetical protein